MRVARGVWNLRSQRAFRCVTRALAAEKRQARLRIVHYSVQGNHLHLIAEADDPAALSLRMRGFTVRLARALNRMMGRPRGRVFAERYHLHVLRTRSEVRNAIRYVLLNHRKHAAQAGRVGITVDPFSSGPWFEHWPPDVVRVPWSMNSGPPPIAQPRSSLLGHAWRRSESMPGVRSSGAIANG